MSQERLLVVLKDAMSRAESECPAALRRGEEAFATGMNTWLGVLLPYVSEEDREMLIAAMSAMVDAVQRPRN